MKRHLKLLLCVALIASAQEPIRVSTRLVELEVIAREGDGPAANLTAADFSVQDRGKEQKIVIFEENKRTKNPAQQTLPAGTVTNRYAVRTSDSGSVNTTVILIDRLNTRLADQVFVKRELLAFLKSIRPQDQAAIYTLGSNLAVLQDFTDNPAVLRQAVNKLSSETANQVATSDDLTSGRVSDEMLGVLDKLQVALGSMAEFDVKTRESKTLTAIAEIAKHLTGEPGRKNLVWISGGFPLRFDVRTTLDFSSDLAKTTRALNDADVAGVSGGCARTAWDGDSGRGHENRRGSGEA